jgi:Cu(I)/Ag(I) efflux system membrane protein CusA/SilA
LITVLFATWFLAGEWLPLGAHNSLPANFLFVAGIVGVILLALMSMVHYYEQILRWALANKWKFRLIPAGTILFGLMVWQGSGKILGFIRVP